MSLFEPRTPVFGGEGEELQKVQQLLTENHIAFKLKPGSMGRLVMVKRSLADKAEMLVREARNNHGTW